MGHENSGDFPVRPETIDTMATESMDITPFVTEMLRQIDQPEGTEEKVEAARP
jgi:hypothetical protein